MPEPPVPVTRRTRRLVHLFLLVFAVTGVAHLELFPFSGFRLFAEVRGDERVSWQLRAVDPDGHEHSIRLGALPLAYRNTSLLLLEFPSLDEAGRDAICDAWAQPRREAGSAVAVVRVYRVVERVRPGSPPPTRTLAYECGGST